MQVAFGGVRRKLRVFTDWEILVLHRRPTVSSGTSDPCDRRPTGYATDHRLTVSYGTREGILYTGNQQVIHQSLLLQIRFQFDAVLPARRILTCQKPLLPEPQFQFCETLPARQILILREA